MKRIILRLLAGLGAVLVAGLAIVKLVYGGGEPYPDISTPPETLDHKPKVVSCCFVGVNLFATIYVMNTNIYISRCMKGGRSPITDH